MGINLGDIIEDEQRLFGDGVNIAARLERLAQSGGICLWMPIRAIISGLSNLIGKSEASSI
jgi:adenylate cyclase